MHQCEAAAIRMGDRRFATSVSRRQGASIPAGRWKSSASGSLYLFGMDGHLAMESRPRTCCLHHCSHGVRTLGAELSRSHRLTHSHVERLLISASFAIPILIGAAV